jgi:hypothetical protein
MRTPENNNKKPQNVRACERKGWITWASLALNIVERTQEHAKTNVAAVAVNHCYATKIPHISAHCNKKAVLL